MIFLDKQMVFFRYWNFTTCLDCNNLDILEQKINKLLEEEENCFRLSQLPKLNVEPKQLRYGYLLETDASGHIALSGSPGADYPDNFQFYNEPKVNQPDFIQQFSLIEVPESMQVAININESPEVKKQEAEIQKLEKDGSPEYYQLIQDVPGYTERIDHAMADLFDPQGNYWFITKTLAYKVYQEPQELELLGARLLYFHPPSSYQAFTKPKNNSSSVDNDISSQTEDELPF